MKTEMENAINALTEKAKAAPSHEALHFTQAALNLAHTLQVVKQTESMK
jgi:hypothetical protein